MSHADEMQRFYDEVSAGRLSVIEELLTEDFVEHDPFAPAPTREGTRQFFEMSLAAFPDMRFAVSHMVGEGDLVMAFGNFEGTHKADHVADREAHVREGGEGHLEELPRARRARTCSTKSSVGAPR